MENVALVIPCYNESRRLDLSQLDQLMSEPGITLFLVDDGSTDETARLLADFAAKYPPDRVCPMMLPKNVGKAEAVRLGLLSALAKPVALVGYADADFATPASEVLRVVRWALSEDRDVFLGARIRMLGRSIQRAATRHYLGRIFATFASLTLRLPTYDTQCGLKLFRPTPTLNASLAAPFSSRWIFDVELISRLVVYNELAKTLPIERVVEVPLNRWEDKAGSRLTMLSMVRAAWDLLNLSITISRQR